MNPVSNEICRMSWFLVETDDALRRGLSHPNGKAVFCIIHSVDLIDGDPSDMYINRVVRFNHNHAIVHGKILLASDDRLFVERQLKQMTRNSEEAVVRNENDKRYLVQYNKGSNTIVHAILHHKELVWMSNAGDVRSGAEVIIRDGGVQRLASLLYEHEHDEKLQTQLQHLKAKCWNDAFDVKDEETDMTAGHWLLVQYSSSPTNVIYSVINFGETVWQEENLYKDVVAYITDGSTVYQAIIIRKSLERCELDDVLSHINKTTAATKFPLEGEAAPILAYQQTPGNASTKGLPVDHQALCAKSMQVEHPPEPRGRVYSLKDVMSWDYFDEMEQQMHSEAALVAEAFEAIDYIRRMMQKSEENLQPCEN